MENINIIEIAKNAKGAFLKTMNLSVEIKNKTLAQIAKKIEVNKDLIFKANEQDLQEAKKMLDENKINLATFNRLKINENKINDLITGLNDLIKLDDPVNKTLWQKELDEDLILKKIATPIGVIGVIFEARPDCFIQIASLIIKSGNCAILKGGSEANNTNTLFAKLVNEALDEIDFPKNAINLVYSREDIKTMLDLDKYISLIIPRGSNALVKFIKENTKIPVLGHASGICHIFIDESADLKNVASIVIDAKTQYPSACNAVETVLVHKNWQYLKDLKEELTKKNIQIVENPDTFEKEYGDTILSLKIVDNIDQAIEHINQYGSGHTDSILTKDEENIKKFMNFVDSSSVFANCSTRFSDGFRYGFGAEVGISTNKTHARGPVGLEGLTIYKYKLFGKNQIVMPYATGEKTFNHKFI
ncbi:MAG: glutamate-5-semialdehyde dehydrogenase [Candidatus Gastranaerophilales bacterium]|nr:glutamate-5-semialdehyde dehydrogenase [Candidatus Gastranaerophilales bacterium]